MKKEKSIGGWIRKNKKALLIAGATIVAVTGAILVVKNREVIEVLITGGAGKGELSQALNLGENMPNLAELLEQTSPSSGKIIAIQEHLRRLPEGYHASARKIAEAAEAGIVLGANQTLVSAYSRNCVA